MPEIIQHFLLVYSHKQQELLRMEEFGHAEMNMALCAYADAEREFSSEEDYEVVLLGSDSVDTIKNTHGRYFAANSSADPFGDIQLTLQLS